MKRQQIREGHMYDEASQAFGYKTWPLVRGLKLYVLFNYITMGEHQRYNLITSSKALLQEIPAPRL